jgi:hypothetical protein
MLADHPPQLSDGKRFSAMLYCWGTCWRYSTKASRTVRSRRRPESLVRLCDCIILPDASQLILGRRIPHFLGLLHLVKHILASAKGDVCGCCTFLFYYQTCWLIATTHMQQGQGYCEHEADPLLFPAWLCHQTCKPATLPGEETRLQGR